MLTNLLGGAAETVSYMVKSDHQSAQRVLSAGWPAFEFIDQQLWQQPCSASGRTALVPSVHEPCAAVPFLVCC